jgi:catechol 2,3-dioxygenase-like lactoylglutathione lyase family enzyme
MGHFIGIPFCSAQRHRFRWRFSSAARRDGFGHVAFSVHDVEETCNELDTAGVKFQSLA